MSDKQSNELEEMSDFLQKGIKLEAEIEYEGLAVRESSKIAYKEQLLDARLIFMSVFRYLLEVKSRVPGKTNESISERLVLIHLFIQGQTFTERSISEGQYLKAAAVLKQDYEILTRIAEVKGGTAKTGKVPNVRHAPKGSQRFYGELNDVAHPSNLHLLQSIIRELRDGEVQAVSAVPAFNQTVARSFYELHVWLLLQVSRELIGLYLEMYDDADRDLIVAMQHIRVAIGFLKVAGFKSTNKDAPT